MSTSGGRANEAGSLHRSGFAAVLAAYALRGLPLPFLDDGTAESRTVTSLQFETSDAVDDIRCVMKDGSYTAFQAKRSCGNDHSLASTVRQWEQQANTLRNGDRIGLVVRNPRGPVRDLKAALHDRRSEFPGPETGAKRSAIQAVTSKFSSTIGQDSIDAVLRASHCVTCAAENPGDAQFDIAVSLLDGVVVATGLGEAAFKHLQRNFQGNAASGEGSGIPDWIAWLSDAGCAPRSDPYGTPGQQVAAEDLAIAKHRESWAKRENRLNFALLAQDLPTIEVPGLARTFRVSVPSNGSEEEKEKSLLAVARRWDRFVLVGLPGSGKSTAINQLAANWSAQADAPIPLVVPLKEVSERINDPAHVTLSLILDIATLNFEPNLRGSLRKALERQIGAGNVALLLDGLDECRHLAGLVSLGLEEMLHEIDSSIPIIVSSRDNTIPAARKLGFKEVRLIEPSFLDSTMDKVLRVAAETRVPIESRDTWLEAKRQSIEDAKDKNRDIWQVPLLATLLTLLTASTETDALPQSRAQILLEVVRDSVRKWEVSRLTIDPPGTWNESLKPAHLIDGFATIGHAISGTDAVSTNQIDEALVLMLRSRWDLSTGEADAVAPQIRWFWDERVGVFVATNHGRKTEARSRQFVEIADAIWVMHQGQSVISSWVAESIRDPSMQETISLASGLSATVSTFLMDAALGDPDTAVRARGLLWLLESEIKDPTIPPDRLQELITATCAQYRDAEKNYVPTEEVSARGILTVEKIERNVNSRQLKVDGFGWVHLVCLAQVKMSSDFRALRDSEFASLGLTELRASILKSLVSLTDANAEDRDLAADEINLVYELLRTPIAPPDRQPPTQISRRRVVFHPNEPLLTGHEKAALLTLNHLEHFSDDVLEHLQNVAERGSASNYPTFAEALGRRGIEMMSQVARNMKKLVNLFGEDDWWGKILDPVSLLPIEDGTPALDRRERWKLRALVGVMEAMGVAEVGIGDYREATESDASFLPTYIHSFASICGFNVSSCALQARLVLDADESERREEYDFIFTTLGEPDPAFLKPNLEHLETMVSGLFVNSDWIAHLSCWVLTQLRDERAVPHLAAQISSAQPQRKSLGTIALCLSSPVPSKACEDALTSTDPAVRAGAAQLARMAAPEDQEFEAAHSASISDDDMTVRWAASKDMTVSANGTFWSCPECSGRNEPDALDCAHCSTGGRPFD